MSSFEDRVRLAMQDASGGAAGAQQRRAAEESRRAPLRRSDPLRAVSRYFSRYKQLDGRCGRAEFWWAAGLVNGSALWLWSRTDPQQEGGIWLLLILANLLLLVPLATAAVRRLHDIGRPGGLLLAFLLPICVSQLVVAFFLLNEPTGDNLHGPASQ